MALKTPYKVKRDSKERYIFSVLLFKNMDILKISLQRQSVDVYKFTKGLSKASIIHSSKKPTKKSNVQKFTT